MIMLSREYADSTHTHIPEKKREEEAIYLYVNGLLMPESAAAAGNEVRESQEIFSPTRSLLLFSAAAGIKY